MNYLSQNKAQMTRHGVAMLGIVRLGMALYGGAQHGSEGGRNDRPIFL